MTSQGGPRFRLSADNNTVAIAATKLPLVSLQGHYGYVGLR